MLKNTLGYHRMFLVQGPGIAYGFTMDKRETSPKNWPVGTNLYFSADGETPNGLILTVSAADEGKTLTTDVAGPAPKDLPKSESARVATVTFRLKNPSLLPKKIAVVTYEPGTTGNGTTITVLRPFGSAGFKFPVGTKLYLANSEQVDIVMSGKRIDKNEPFLVVKAEDAGKSFEVK